ncbi:hypothetical protein [Aurantiacibacter rhizosphaerae]|uniref:Uncharacterized protein n=1 Tax=Aurantiacibacter rhizosphaerae TaxID=2691582 RepID=A0A844XBY9_9SPHN|nr:hypothetical protein [Aurantiacibacter rhizosphaerae]MWV27138.1 hypothetical protein [Aurantiacibacter rhizosphaerae]
MNSQRMRDLACMVAAGLAMVAGPAWAEESGQGATDAASQSVQRPTPEAPVEGARNFTGVWERYPLPWPTYLHDFDDVPPPDQGPDLKEPYATQWKEQRFARQEAVEAGTPLVDPSTKCLPEGMPSMMQAIYPIEILQTPGQITVLAELFMQTRRIYMDVPMPPVDEIPPSYNGFSAAHWEGDTLVIVTRGVKEDVQFFEIPHSREMTITERFQLGADGKLYLDISIVDPAILQTPYEFRWIYKKSPGYRIPEYVCDNLHDTINPDGTVTLDTSITEVTDEEIEGE